MAGGAGLGIGLGLSGVGSILGAAAGNSVQQVPVAAPTPVYSGLNSQYLQQLTNITSGGSAGGASGVLSNFINNGYNVLPEWQSMITAAQPQIQQGQQALNEQFGSQGMRYSSVMANADVNYQSQVQNQWLSTLAQLSQSSMTQQVSAAEYGMNLASGPATQTYQATVPVVGKNSVLGAGASSAGSGLTTISLLSQLGLI